MLRYFIEVKTCAAMLVKMVIPLGLVATGLMGE